MIKSLTLKAISRPNSSSGEIYQIFEEKLTPIMYNVLKTTKEEIALHNVF